MSTARHRWSRCPADRGVYSRAMIAKLVTSVVMVAGLAGSAAAGDYVCKGDRVEKGGSTQFVVKRDGRDLSIEKASSTVARAVQRNSKLHVEVAGSTKATIENGKIEKGGSSWGTVDDAQKQFECDGNVAATLWVLFQIGLLP